MHFSPAFVLAALPFLAAAMPSPQPNGMTIPLAKRSGIHRADGTVDRAAMKASVQSSLAKIQRGFEAYERNTGSVHSLAKSITMQKRGTGSDSLTDADQELWYGEIEVGTPPKRFTVDFDTGSSDLFLPGPQCGSSCSGHAVYNPRSSSSSKDRRLTFSLQYGDGSTVSGEQYSDTVQIAGLTAKAQAVGAAKTYSTGFNSQRFPADGLLGMAFQSISQYNAPPFFQSLANENAVSEQAFSFKLAKSGSSLYLGGADQSQYKGAFTYVPLTQEAYWQVNLDGVSVNGKRIVGVTSSIIDTGTTLIVGDSQSIASVYSAIGGASANNDGTYTVPCNLRTPVSLTFGGKSFTLAPETFVLDNGDGTCVGGFFASDQVAGEFWIVGDVFLQNVYTKFDLGGRRVGFASLK